MFSPFFLPFLLIFIPLKLPFPFEKGGRQRGRKRGGMKSSEESEGEDEEESGESEDEDPQIVLDKKTEPQVKKAKREGEIRRKLPQRMAKSLGPPTAIKDSENKGNLPSQVIFGA